MFFVLHYFFSCQINFQIFLLVIQSEKPKMKFENPWLSCCFRCVVIVCLTFETKFTEAKIWNKKKTKQNTYHLMFINMNWMNHCYWNESKLNQFHLNFSSDHRFCVQCAPLCSFCICFSLFFVFVLWFHCGSPSVSLNLCIIHTSTSKRPHTACRQCKIFFFKLANHMHWNKWQIIEM